MNSPKTRCALLSCLLVLASAGAALGDREGAVFFEEMRQAYAERSTYADVGEIEITEAIDGVESSEQHFFETSATREAGLAWRVMTVTDRGPEDQAVWKTGDSVMLYDGAVRQAKPAASVAEAIAEALGPEAGQAFVVLALLDAGASSASFEALASTATVGEPRDCFGDRRCRILLMPLEDRGQIRLTVETGTYWIHDVEVVLRQPSAAGSAEAGSGGAVRGALAAKTTTVRVSHSETSFADRGSDPGAVFEPPPSTLEVRDLDSSAPEEGDSTFAPEGTYFEVVTVELLSVMTRFVDASGTPLPGIEPSDLIATAGDHEVPIAAVDWYGKPLDLRPDLGRLESGIGDISSEPGGSGRLLVIFLQNDFEPSRVKGHMKLFPGLRQMIDNLRPADRVAVVSFYAHLKLWQDFTSDREAAQASLGRAFFPGAEPGEVAPGEGPSLLPYFDREAAREVASSAEALQFTADALAAVPGEKDILFFGYGLEGGNLQRMLRALNGARATIFVVDTTQADGHTLSGTLVSMAASTGGTYGSSFYYADRALDRIERTIAGHYQVTLDLSAQPDAAGRLSIRLRDKKGTVLMAPMGLR